MKTPLLIAKLTPLVIIAMVAVVAVAYAHGGLPDPASAQDSPAVGIGLSPSGSVDEGDAITVTMSFGNLESDDDRATTDYIFRADVVGADQCEDQAGGYGLGVDRKINLVDEDPEVRRGGISADCPAGEYTLRASISDADGAELASATASFSVAAPEPPPSTDATLSSLALSGVTLEFDPVTTTYTAEVGNDLAETTVTPTVNHDGATYVVRLDGADDGIIPLSVGENVISVLVTAEDRETTRTYTVTVTRAEATPERSSDATLSGLALSGVTLAFDPATTTYTAEVGNDLAETTVTPTPNDDGATYAVRLDGAADDDGVVPLSVGENVISVLVAAEDDETTRTYTVTVTRAEPPTSDPTVAIALSPSDTIIEGEGDEIAVTMSFGNLTFDDDRATTDYTFRADVKDSEDGDADGCEEQAGGYGLGVDRKINQVDEDPETRRGTISADCPAGDYTIRARISLPGGSELASASASFSVAAPKPEPPIVFLAMPTGFAHGEEAQLSMAFGNLEQDSDRSTVDYIFRADVKDSEDADADGCEEQAGSYGLGVDRKINLVDEDPEVRRGTISADCPAGDYTLRASISSSDNQELASASAPFSVAAPEEEPESAEQQGSDGDQQDASCKDQTDYVLNSDRDRQPRITSAVYDATLDAVVLEWSAGSDIAGLTGFKIRRFAEGGMTEETYADLCDDPDGTDSRPSVGETVRRYEDVGVPATWLMIYNVYAIYGDKEVISQTVAADMSAAHGMVRARMSSDGRQTVVDIGWMDKGSLEDGYKVYIQRTGTDFWDDITLHDTDPAPQRFATLAIYSVNLRFTIRIRHGGTDADTGTLIGEVSTTVVAAQ